MGTIVILAQFYFLGKKETLVDLAGDKLNNRNMPNGFYREQQNVSS